MHYIYANTYTHTRTHTLYICVYKRLLSAQAGCFCACYEHSGDEVFLKRSAGTGALRAGCAGERRAGARCRVLEAVMQKRYAKLQGDKLFFLFF